MIKNHHEYQETLQRIRDNDQLIALQRQELEAAQVSPAEIERILAPILTFRAQLVEELQWYEAVRERHFETVHTLTDIGRLLIALRIANGVTQTELAERLGVSASQVSRDERNEYYGVTVERAQRVVEALNESLRIQVENERQGHALSPFEAALTVGAPRFRQEASTNDVMGRISPQAYGVATAPSSSTHPHHVRLRGSSS